MMKYAQVRSSGDDTLLSIEINDDWRKVTVSRDALESHLRVTPDAAAAISPEQRCELVRENMAFVFAAVRRKIRTRPDAKSITLLTGEM